MSNDAKTTKNADEYDDSIPDQVAYFCKKYAFPVVGTAAAGCIVYLLKDVVWDCLTSDEE